MQPNSRYTRTAVALHWLMALLIAAQAGLGWYMTSIEDEGGERYFGLHMSMGLIVAGLLVWRIAWRLRHRPPSLPQTIPAWQRAAAHATHWFLYAAMAAMPLAGFLGASMTKEGVVFLGQPLPRLASPDHDMAEQFFAIHSLIATLLVVAVAVHVLAGLKHLLLDKDGVFERMWVKRRLAPASFSEGLHHTE